MPPVGLIVVWIVIFLDILLWFCCRTCATFLYNHINAKRTMQKRRFNLRANLETNKTPGGKKKTNTYYYVACVFYTVFFRNIHRKIFVVSMYLEYNVISLQCSFSDVRHKEVKRRSVWNQGLQFNEHEQMCSGILYLLHCIIRFQTVWIVLDEQFIFFLFVYIGSQQS